MEKRFEQLEQTGDIKIRVFGSTLEELFKNALYGMFCVIEPQYAKNHTNVTHELEITSPSRELLLVDFLSESLYLSDVHNEAYYDAHFTAFSDTHLKGTVIGKTIVTFEVVEIKAVTYHDLHIKKVNGQWQTELVFDI